MSAALQHPLPSRVQRHFEHFVAAHDWSKDHSKIELLDEKIVVTPPGGHPHAEIIANTFFAIRSFVQSQKLGVVFESSAGFDLPTGDHVIPDVSFVTAARWASTPKVAGASYAPVVPDLVVEVLSPSNADHDRGPKRSIYEANGVREYWLIDHQRRIIAVLVRDDGRGAFAAERTYRDGDRVVSSVLAGLDVAVSDVLPI